ncbi:MAG: hypothetical protein JWP71_419 [Mucilaginibacter sp.]|nr:hypothetical protein [Mucilaginibacter sp.]
MKFLFYPKMIWAAFLKCWIGKMQKYLLIIGLITGFAFAALAQEPAIPVKKIKADSIQAKKDSLKSKPFIPKITSDKVYHPDTNHSPHKAVIHSLMIPGWGQLYNHQWWKVPVIYAGLGLIAWAYVFNEKYYKETLAIAKYRQQGTQPGKNDPYYDVYPQYTNASVTAIDDAVRGYARYRDISVFGFVAGWGIQAVDAYIDAKFMHSYSMDKDFAFKITPINLNSPMYAQNFNGSFIPGLKLTFTLR